MVQGWLYIHTHTNNNGLHYVIAMTLIECRNKYLDTYELKTPCLGKISKISV